MLLHLSFCICVIFFVGLIPRDGFTGSRLEIFTDKFQIALQSWHAILYFYVTVCENGNHILKQAKILTSLNPLTMQVCFENTLGGKIGSNYKTLTKTEVILQNVFQTSDFINFCGLSLKDCDQKLHKKKANENWAVTPMLCSVFSLHHGINYNVSFCSPKCTSTVLPKYI